MGRGMARAVAGPARGEGTIGSVRRTPVAALLAGVTAALVLAAPAAASPVLVLRQDGRVVVRDDPYIPPATAHGPDGTATATVAVSPRARARAAAPKAPTVRAELRRLQDAGLLDAATADSYRDAYDKARATLRKLTGYRRAQLAAVLANVDAAAAGGLFAPSRLPALFLTLQRNRAWWGAAPIPAPGGRVTFQGSELVWQHYPGQGLQIQWLATFGKANGLWRARDHDAQLRALLDEALGLATDRAGGLAFEYQFRFDGGRPPWVSGLSQGTGLSAFSRAAVRLGEPKYFQAARAALGIFRTAPPDGVRVDTPAGAHYLQYSFAPGLHVVNGFTQALNGLHDFAVLANDPEGHELFDAGEAELRVELPGFDTGAWSLYSKPGAESDLAYHELLIDFLNGLCQRLVADEERAVVGGAEAQAIDPTLYCDTAHRFTTYLHVAPAVAIAPGPPLRQKATGALQFTVSKISTVTVTVVRRGTAVLRRTARVGSGQHAIAFRPAHAGSYEVRVRAIDLAGNPGSAETVVSVRPAPKKHRSH